MLDHWKHIISRMRALGLNQEQIRLIGQVDLPHSFQQEYRIRSLLKENSQKRRIDLQNSLLASDFIVLDTETTGFFPEKGDQVISLAAVKISHGKILPSVFFTYIKPSDEITIPQPVIELTKIDETVLYDAPSLEEVIKDFLDFVGHSLIVGFHISHDLLFLNHFLQEQYQMKMEQSGFELQKVLQAIVPENPFKDLDQALEYYAIPIYRRHHALDDSLMTAKLWIKILQECKKNGIVTLFDLYSKIT
ncbi:exonuclease domain-containing protein [Tepidibacillus marianensis]|uniref:exonuclease domain-containing protein n=1 Tax=Tepidibacillus marianensis TaxID=3131995 RepID=UPI0030D3CADD